MKIRLLILSIMISSFFISCKKDNPTDLDPTLDPIPYINDISSNELISGAELTINGKNFGTIIDTNFVTFNSKRPTTYISWKDNSIQVKIPYNISSGKLYVTVRGMKSNEIDYLLNPNEVVIGSNTWMTKNLDVDHFRNGDPIPHITDSGKWFNDTTGAWCYYNNDPANGAIYGKLYNLFAVNDMRELAPLGWHVATDAEWTSLITLLGGDWKAGGKLKETGTTHWISPNIGATNEFGFTALPGGFRPLGKDDDYLCHYGYWWSVSQKNSAVEYYITLDNRFETISRGTISNNAGLSVRCVKD